MRSPVAVARGATSSASDSVQCRGSSGYYRWRVRSYSGQGGYGFWRVAP